MASVGLEKEEEVWEDGFSLFDEPFSDVLTMEERRRLDAEECRRREAEKEETEEKARQEEEKKRSWEFHNAVLESIQEYSPKEKRTVFTRFFMTNFYWFDINEESPVPPMRYTHRE